MAVVTNAIDAGIVKACHDLSEGGLAVAAAEMAFSGGYGLDLALSNVLKSDNVRRNDFTLFSESNSRFLVEVPKKRKDDFEECMNGAAFSLVGRTKKERCLSIRGLDGKLVVETSLKDLMDAWKETFGG
jgi:phosphoribosylformylglycinamidine (FGAM) synthase-like enzyme